MTQKFTVSLYFILTLCQGKMSKSNRTSQSAETGWNPWATNSSRQKVSGKLAPRKKFNQRYIFFPFHKILSPSEGMRKNKRGFFVLKYKPVLNDSKFRLLLARALNYKSHYNIINHKNYNFLNCDWFKNSYFLLILRSGCYRTPCYRTVLMFQPIYHVSVSPTDGNEPTQGQRKTLTRVGFEPTTFEFDHRCSTDWATSSDGSIPLHPILSLPFILKISATRPCVANAT